MNRTFHIAASGALMVAGACSPEQGSPAQQGAELTRPANLAGLPALTGRVVDQADLLRPEHELELTSKSAALEAQTGRQFVVVTVNTLNGRDVANYTTRLGNAWGIGRKEHDDGVILLVAPNERKVRIAVGSGLEKTLTDARCAQIIKERILPHFRKGDMAAGIIAGADAAIAQLAHTSGENLKQEAAQPARHP